MSTTFLPRSEYEVDELWVMLQAREAELVRCRGLVRRIASLDPALGPMDLQQLVADARATLETDQ